ncbi:helix-turn-helix domain-containing protein, partial [Cereibacter sphaeroides]|nr:helix-turn-helix domain-containing protein [Cereibacter sphaeroides]
RVVKMKLIFSVRAWHDYRHWHQTDARTFKRLNGLITRLQVIALEAGKANPTLETLQKIATPFGFQVGFVARGRADVSGDAGG